MKVCTSTIEEPVDERFADIVYSDDHLVDLEFQEIVRRLWPPVVKTGIATSWSAPFPGRMAFPGLDGMSSGTGIAYVPHAGERPPPLG